MLREGLRTDGRMQLLRSAERCPHEINIVSNTWCRGMEQDTTDSGIIYRAKVRSLLVDFIFEKLSQLTHLSREHLVSGIEDTAERNCSDAIRAWRRFVQIALKLLDGVAKIGVDTSGGGGSLAGDQKLDAISREA